MNRRQKLNQATGSVQTEPLTDQEKKYMAENKLTARTFAGRMPVVIAKTKQDARIMKAISKKLNPSGCFIALDTDDAKL